MAAFILTADQEVGVTVVFNDDHGNVATIPAAPVWASSDATILTVTAAADGMSAVVAAVGLDGTAQASVSAVSDAGVTIGGVLDVQVVSGAAAAAVLTAGTPTATTAAPAVTPTP